MNKTTFVYALFLSLGLSACDGSGGGKKSSSTPKSDAIHKLSATHQANLEAWKNRVVKSCDSSEAFGLGGDEHLEMPGIDSGSLLKSNGNSIIFSDANNWVILNGYNSLSGEATSSTDQNTNINVKTYQITASTKREGSICSLFLFGEKIYETRIYQSFTIGAHYFNGKNANAKTNNQIVKPLGINGYGEATQHALLNLLNETVKPGKDALTFMATKLGIKQELTQKLFMLGGYGVANSAFRLAGDSSAVWSNSESGNLIASITSLNQIFNGSPKDLTLDIQLAVPQFDFGTVKNSADIGNLSVILNAVVEQNGNDFTATLKSARQNGIITYNLVEAQICAKLRSEVYVGSATVANQVVPTVRTLLGPCSTLHLDIEETSYKSGFFKSLISEVLKDVTPSAKINYGGWDFVLGRLAVEAIDANIDITSELDPNGKTEIISSVAETLKSLKSEIEKSKNMQPAKGTVYQMGVNWSLKGHLVSAGRIDQIIQAVDNSVTTFKTSTERLLNSLSFDPNSNDTLINFALNLDNNYKSEATKALKLANELSYSEFTSEVFNQIIQKQIPLSELNEWIARLTSIKTEISKYKSLVAYQGSLVRSTIAGLKKGEVTIPELAEVYSALNNAIDPFADSTIQLSNDLAQSFTAQKDTLSFAAGITAEYKKLALSIRDQSKLAEYESWGSDFFRTILQRQPTLEQLRQWNVLWGSVVTFVQKEKTLVAGGMMASSAEWNRKKVIEQAVKEIWSAQDFSALETITGVAKYKSTCTNYKDASSLADCAGLSLFSNAPKKFLDAKLVNSYRSLAADYKFYMNQLSDFNWTTLRWTLLDALFGTSTPIWSGCDAGTFAIRASTLRGQVKAITVETDQLKKWQLESQIKETIKNCQ